MKNRFLLVLFFLCLVVAAFSGGVSQTGNTIGGSSGGGTTDNTKFPLTGGTVSGPSTFSSTLGVGSSTFISGRCFASSTLSLTTPAFAFLNDSDTGMAQDNPNSITFMTGGVEALFFASGNCYNRTPPFGHSGVGSWNLATNGMTGTATTTPTIYLVETGSPKNSGLGRYGPNMPDMVAGGAACQAWLSTQTLLLQKPVLPSVSSATIDSLTAVMAGSMVFNSTSSKVQVYDGAAWRNLW